MGVLAIHTATLQRAFMVCSWVDAQPCGTQSAKSNLQVCPMPHRKPQSNPLQTKSCSTRYISAQQRSIPDSSSPMRAATILRSTLCRIRIRIPNPKLKAQIASLFRRFVSSDPTVGGDLLSFSTRICRAISQQEVHVH